jgi:uncharacterized protein YlxW (UPF0749 family)
MKKQGPAILAALVITVLVGVGMLAIGGNALLNTASVPVQNLPDTGSQKIANSVAPAADAAQVEQLKSLVSQYQQREQQYQNQLKEAQQQIDQASSEINQYQQLVQFLVNRGIIQVNSNGQILVPNRGGQLQDDH